MTFQPLHVIVLEICLPLFLIQSFHNDDMKSLKCHVTLLRLIFLLNTYIYWLLIASVHFGITKVSHAWN